MEESLQNESLWFERILSEETFNLEDRSNVSNSVLFFNVGDENEVEVDGKDEHGSIVLLLL